jgi:hypothetical protein
MDPAEVRRIAITAMFADDSLPDSVVLKGGNALNLVSAFGHPSTSTFSIDADFPDPNDA